MKKLINKIFHNSFLKGGLIFIGIEMLNKLFPFFLLPIIAIKLSPEDFGIITNYTVLISMLMIFINFGGIPNIIIKYRLDKENNQYDDYLNSSFIVSVINVVLISIITLPFIFLGVFSKYMGLSNNMVVLALGESFFDVILGMFIALSRFTKSYKDLIIIRLGQTLVGFILSIILIFNFKMGYEGRIWAIFGSAVFFGVIAIFRQGYRFNDFIMKNLWPKCVHLYKISWPLIPHQLSKILRNSSDKVLLTTFVSLAANGLYSLALQFATIYYVITESFSISILPSIYEKLKLKENPKNAIKKFNVLCWGILIPAYFGSFFLIHYFFDERYQNVKFYLIPILLAFLMRSLNLMQGNQFLFFQETKKYAKITFSTSILHLILSIVIVKFLGFNGLIYLLLFTETLIYFVTNIKLKKLYIDEGLY